MKKLLLSALLILLAASLFADFTFELVPSKPLYPSSLVDPVSSLTGVHFLMETKSEETNNIFLYNKSEKEYETYDYLDWNDSFKKNMHLSAGGNFALFRCSWDDIQVEFLGQAGLNSIFSLGGDKDMLGMDGTYFAGFDANLFNMFAVKAGIKHYSGHWGDEILIKAGKKMMDDGLDTRDYNYYEFVRDNQWKLGVAFTGLENLNVSLSLEAPLPNSNVRPFLDTPDSLKDVNGNSYYEENPDQAAKRGELGPFYHAFIAKLEAQYTLPINNELDAVFGGNIKMHQEGITNYTIDKTDDNPLKWDVEYTLIASLIMKNVVSDHGVSLDFIFHDGRFPLLNYNFKHSQYFSIGLSLR